jgi:Putative lumazine-binding
MSTSVSAADEVESFAEHEAIAATLQRYIDAASSGKGSLMGTAFAEGARVRGTYGGKPVDWTLPEFCGLIDKGGPIADLQARIVSIEYIGNAGMARLEARNWRGTRYTDFFVLIKREDGWRISDKVFYAHSRA